ncbi:hypothetical protein A3A14_03840 [Candidatus Daviesbacteria bacterium RIFCSPLOWO2_01_FULL_43_38]|uniref:DUF3800 domain-containing protein n=1 Tax=Candidatus Daviesbacteria bacterium RIFCSPHIGHO2_12_FULL_43_11 TaxID=1797780 RepID=A0A1F5K889_9BACT|nr:MAG: hypothetical protein A2874_00170 [Candidatus Daviesbacteria bacterium RIFCSPHIGHO2_01_FULL_43_17]OGE36990.1 MAG: hypothetical protein A3E45_01960 [Candidatus Daviesbacteria bacterium RIFCSPHIGHO2_12_FULL_43_11]OGE63942.1 MAG: hypothetical protein A3A14_03840 [Candidatus Daviesbacteria bacterium RIFCSPLOWO2_01_FULL_43_38]
MFIYLDESGNLTKSNGKYFLVASFTVGDPKRIAKAFRKWQKSKFPRKLKSQPEVKFNDSHLTDDLRISTLKFLAKQDVRIFYTYLNVTNIPKEYRGKEGSIKTGHLYTQIVGDTLNLYLPITETEFRVFRDQRILKGVILKDFNEHLMTQLLPQLPAKTIIQIQAMDSTTSAQIQVADWICGALARYHEKKPQGKEFYNILKNNIIKEEELFSDYWTKKWEK